MRRLIFLIISLLINGCTVGPRYVRPSVNLPNNYKENLPNKTTKVKDEDLVHWWSTFNDPFLDQLLEITVNQNFDFRIALERVYQARAQYWIQFTQILPEFNADAQASRFRTSQSFGNSPEDSSTSTSSPANGAAPPNAATNSTTATISPIQNFFQIGLDAIWELDLFGKLRRSAKAAYHLWEATEEDLRGVKITVLSEVANTYTTICAYQQKKNIAMQIVDLDRELLSLSRVKVEAGLADQQEVERAIAVLETDTAQLITIQTSLKQLIYSLATLLGELPETVMDNFQYIDRPIPRSVGKVPASLPSDLLRRRPDIQSVERQLAAATEEIGVAVANLFPSLSLTGSSSSFAANPLQGANVGLSSNSLDKLFRKESLIWGIGGLLTVPVFDFGKRTAAVKEQWAIRNQVCYNYQKTVMGALQETEQALATYFNEERREKSLQKEFEANWNTLSLTADLFQAGLVDYSQVLTARDNWLASFNALTDSQQALTTDLIAIYKALGGEW